MPKKTCEICKKENHPRAKICSCGNKFIFKPKKKEKYKSVDWKQLEKGDIINVRGGPLWLDHSGNSVPMGYKGKYIVSSVDEKGIVAYGFPSGGFCHIWMADKQVKEDGLIKIPHKIKKIK